MSSAVSGFDFDVDEWDPKTGPLSHHIIAGSIAGIAEHIVMFPADTIKTHMQCDSCLTSDSYTGSSVIRLIKQRGILRLWRGVSTMFVACVPAHMAYFSIYETCKSYTGANDTNEHHPFAAAISGATATFFHDVIMTPMDVVKQRLQLGQYRGTIDCFRTIFNAEGTRAFFLSFPTTLAMNLPYGGAMMASNESLRRILRPDGNLTLTDHIISSSLGAATASFITTPLDVVKTRLQTQSFSYTTSSNHSNARISVISRTFYSTLDKLRGNHSSSNFQSIRTSQTGRSSCLPSNCKMNQPLRYHGLFNTFSVIFKQEGFIGLFRGALPRVCVATPSMTIAWTTYEFVKSKLNNN